MNKQKYNILEFATGFVMGVFIGIVLEFSLLFIYNNLCWWQACQIISFASWLAIPFPLFTGYKMGIIIASLHLEDY